MQIILFLLGLFLIGCVLYGIASGVQSIQRGFLQLTNTRAGDKGPLSKPASVTLTKEPHNESEPFSKVSSLQHDIAELRELFAMLQQGALTQEEFESMKRRLLAATLSPTNIP